MSGMNGSTSPSTRSRRILRRPMLSLSSGLVNDPDGAVFARIAANSRSSPVQCARAAAAAGNQQRKRPSVLGFTWKNSSRMGSPSLPSGPAGNHRAVASKPTSARYTKRASLRFANPGMALGSMMTRHAPQHRGQHHRSSHIAAHAENGIRLPAPD